MTYTVPPLKLPGARSLTVPITRPFNIDPDCVMALLPEINTKWLDYSNKTNHGTITGPTLNHCGRFGPALYFDGTNDRVAIDYNASLYSTEISFSLWVKPARLGTYESLLTYNAIQGFRVDKNGINGIRFTVRNNADAADVAHTSALAFPSADEWYHIVATYSDIDERVKVYVNSISKLDEAHAVGVHFENEPLHLGALWAASNWFKGCMDEVLIFNRVLKSWEIKALCNMGAP